MATNVIWPNSEQCLEFYYYREYDKSGILNIYAKLDYNDNQVCVRFNSNDKFIKNSNSFEKQALLDFSLPNEAEQYQRLIVPIAKLASNERERERVRLMTENEIISTQNEMPENMTRYQYYRLGFIQLHDN